MLLHVVRTVRCTRAGKWLNTSKYMSGSTQLRSACFDNSLAICESLTCSHQCHRLVHQRSCHVLSCLCDNACKRFPAICCKSRHRIPSAGFCLSLYSLYVLNRDVHKFKKTKTKLYRDVQNVDAILFCGKGGDKTSYILEKENMSKYASINMWTCM